MAPPRKKRSGPQSPTGNRNAEPETTPAAAKPGEGTTLALSVERRKPPVVHASVFAPCAGRTWWWLSYICPLCGFGHLGRSRTEAEIAGKRRTRCCERLVDIKVARVYRGRADLEAA